MGKGAKRRTGWSRPGQRRSRRRRLAVMLILLLSGLLITGACYLKITIEPNLEQISKMRAKALVSSIVNRAIQDKFSQEMDISNLLIRSSNEEGKMDLVQADTKNMNLLAAEISRTLQQEYSDIKAEKMEVPAGALLGSKILSQTGPKTAIRIIPLAVSSMDFKTELESQGINQTKYKVYIKLKSEIKVLAPFSSSTFELSNTILVAEAIILGGVPDSYVVVPEEDILDVT